MSDLPQGWEQVKLSDVSERITKGSTPTSYGFKYQDAGIAFIKVESIRNGRIDPHLIRHFISNEANLNQRRSILEAGDILFSIAGTIGATCLVREGDLPANTNQALAIIRGTARVLKAIFLRYQLESEAAREQSQMLERGGGMNNISLADVGNLTVSVPPLNEQRRIVAKLEKLLSRVDTAQARLATIPGILKRFRQSVLAAACSGRLTADWRQDSDQAPLKDSPKPTDAPDVPGSWQWRKLSTIAQVKGGVTKGRKLNGRKTIWLPYLRVANVQDGYLDLRVIKQIEVLPEDKEKYALKAADLLFTEGGDRDKLGRGTVWRDEVANCIHQNHIFRARIVVKDVSADYISIASKSDFSRAYFFSNSSQTVNLASINLTMLSGLPVPLPPLPEQQEIVRRVEALFKTADALEARYRAAKGHVDKLAQSILAKAFRGELVAQDENDEPATRLLERIKAERASPQERPKLAAIAGRESGRTKTTPRSKGIFYRRAALDCYVIEKLEGDPHLGRTKMEKISHLMEHHCDIDLEREPIRDAAGPNDYPSRIRVESLAKKQKWYSAHKRDNGAKIDYLTGPDISKARQTAINFLGQNKTKVDSLLSLLRPLDTKRVEVVATLYASWNDFLLAGKTPTDDELIQDVLNNWHPAKQLIPMEWWAKTLGWMRRKQLIPTGTSRPVTHKLLSESSASPELLRQTKTRPNKKRKQRT